MTGRISGMAAAGLITAAILCAAFIHEGIVPFGTNTLAVTDAYVQYLDLFAYYRDVLTGQNTIGATFSYMLGTGMAGVFAYYLASPFNLLVVLFPKEQMNLFLSVLVVLKLSASAMAFRWFLGRRAIAAGGEGLTAGAAATALSVSYGLMQYNLAQASNIMWLDSVIILPVMLEFVSEIARERCDGDAAEVHRGKRRAQAAGVHSRKRRAQAAEVHSRKRRAQAAEKQPREAMVRLALTVGLGLMISWYTGVINCLFSAVWFVYENVRSRHRVSRGRGIWIKSLRYVIAMALGCLISSATMVPNLLALRLGKGVSLINASADLRLRGNPLSIIEYYRTGAMSDAYHVSLYCGVLAALGAAVYFGAGIVRWASGMAKRRASGGIARRAAGGNKRRAAGGIARYAAQAPAARDLAASAGLLAFVVLMYYWQPLFRVFSLMREVDSYWSRYGYLGCFVILYLASEGLTVLLKAADGGSFERVRGGEEKRAAVRAGQKRRIMSTVLIALVSLNMYRQACVMINIYHSDTAKEYEKYSLRAQKQIEELREYAERQADTAVFYRLNETSTRTCNVDGLTSGYQDPLAYGYASVGGYTSCPENTQLAFLDSIGCREEYDSFNIVNNCFLPADSLLGVRYELSAHALPGLEEITQLSRHNQKSACYNPYALPAAIVADVEAIGSEMTAGSGMAAGSADSGTPQWIPQEERKIWSHPEVSNRGENPFEVLEKLYSELYGEPADLFTPVEADMQRIDGRTIWTLLVPNGMSTEQEKLPIRADLTKEQSKEAQASETRYVLYGNLLWDREFEGKLSVQEGTRHGYGVWLSPSVFLIPVQEGGSPDIDSAEEAEAETGNNERTAEVVLECDEEPPITEAQFYALDLERFAEVTGRIQERSEGMAQISCWNGQQISVAVSGEQSPEAGGRNARTHRVLILSAADSPGWSVYCNGQKVEPESFGGCLIQVPLPEGAADVELKYRTPGRMAGIVMSLAGIFILTVTALTEIFSSRK